MTWKLLDHPHILKFYGVSEELFADTFCMISPWMPHGSLLQYISSVGFVQSDVLRLVCAKHFGMMSCSYSHNR